MALDAKLAKKQELERKQLQAFVDRFSAKATKARQAQSRAQAARQARADRRDRRTTRCARSHFRRPRSALSPPIIALDDVAVGYEPGKPVLRRLSLRIDTDDRIALLGAERQRQVDAREAARRTPRAVRAARSRAPSASRSPISRSISSTSSIPAHSAYDHVRRLMPDAPEAKVRARAGAIGFSGRAADTPVASLSGGEKARLLLGLATFDGPHLLILDEPTNHLDIDSRAALVEAINDYPGAVILVSHDRYLLEACADRLWLVADGTVAPFDGDLDDYRRLVLGRDAQARRQRDEAEQRVSRTDQRRAAAEKREELKPLQAPHRCRREDGRASSPPRSRRSTRSLPSDLFARDPAKATALSKARADAADALAKAEEDWLDAPAPTTKTRWRRRDLNRAALAVCAGLLGCAR